MNVIFWSFLFILELKFGILVVCYEFWLFIHACSECYSEASDHEEAESTEIPPPPYSEQTLRGSVDASGPPGSTHQVSHVPEYKQSLTIMQEAAIL